MESSPCWQRTPRFHLFKFRFMSKLDRGSNHGRLHRFRCLDRGHCSSYCVRLEIRLLQVEPSTEQGALLQISHRRGGLWKIYYLV